MAKTGKHKGSVRIISGKWRGRRIPVAEAPGLRPTGDRVRETLFNWLQPRLPGSRCLDLFAGTGVLGLEAGSRGAASVLLLDRHPRAVAALQAMLAVLDEPTIQVRQADSLAWLGAAPDQGFDIVFVDPPFEMTVQQQVLELLAKPGWLAAGALVYVESAMRNPALTPPRGWQEFRSGKMGEVRLQLLQTAD